MVYIETVADNGSAVYFDIHATERFAEGVRISGTIGDGQYEGEVLVECGEIADVTFADAWLGGEGYREFMARCDLDSLRQALLDVVSGLSLFPTRRDAPHSNKGVQRGLGIAETGPFWRGVA